LRIESLHARDHRDCQARGGVHGQVERDKAGFANGGFGKTVNGEVDATDLVSGAFEPSRGRREPEWLAAHFVRRDEEGAHPSITAGSR
jgi:hypothetical protein